MSGFLLHFGQDIADNFGVCCRFAAAYDGYEGELRPGKGVVEVVFEEIILGEVGEVTLLD